MSGVLGMNPYYYDEEQWKFNNKDKTIDYVLVWTEPDERSNMYNVTKQNISTDADEERLLYETNLRTEGLELEEDFVETTGLHFVKINIPLEILKRYAEILKLRCPIKSVQKMKPGAPGVSEYRLSGLPHKKKYCKCFEVDEVFPDLSEELTATYTRSRDYLFDVKSPGFFTPAQKGRIIQFILERTAYKKVYSEDTNLFEFGINRLIMRGVYIAAYPLHDGDWHTPGTMRNRFYMHWASFRNWYKKQPADQIMLYFGVQISMYFIWLGHYVNMLIYASIVAIVCLMISILLIPFSSLFDDVCDGKVDDFMCPLCESGCGFWRLRDYCGEMKSLVIFDNLSTVIFAICMSLWAGTFLECWKRTSAEITLHWDLTAINEMDENPRPEYAAKVAKLVADNKVTQEMNFVTSVIEPKLNFWKHIFPGRVLSLATTLLLISLAVAAVIGVILYDMFVLTALQQDFFQNTLTTSFMSLVCILMFSPIYRKVAVYLTEIEMHRTQVEFENAYIVKVYLLEFVNNYVSLFYIAFFKAKLNGPPHRHYRVFGHLGVECIGSNCMLELTGQLAVIMIGKRLFTTFQKIILPRLTHKYKKLQTSLGRDFTDAKQWEKDFLLGDEDASQTFEETLDMVLQYGFVTIFVSAFPLAPLFALLNNIFEIRIDAQKLLLYNRRPGYRRASNIGVWYDILHYVSCLAVFTNGFIIAFTSSFVPREVYRLTVNKNFGLEGFVNFTLSYMAVKDLDLRFMPNTTEKYCRYMDFREPPWAEDKYELSRMYWIVLAARFGVFVIFENSMIAAMVILKWLIPDIPDHVKWRLRRRNYLINEIIISYESNQKSWWFIKWSKT